VLIERPSGRLGLGVRYCGRMVTPPARSPEQRAAALEKAAIVRKERARIKELLKTNAMTLAELLVAAETNEVIARLKVLAMLESFPAVGKVKARRLMEEFDIADTRRVRGLGIHQRAGLIERLDRFVNHPED
jgi:hypothetical protein